MTAALLSVFDGRRCAGLLLHRGRVGWEAFDANETSLGIFATRQDAANAIPLQEERCAVSETPRCPR
jgi:hypothetical protein